VHVKVVASTVLRLGEGVHFDGFLAVVDLPNGYEPEQCILRVPEVTVRSAFAPSGLKTHGLQVACELDLPEPPRPSFGQDFIVHCALRILLTLPMVPSMMLLFPTVLGVRAPRPIAMMALLVVLLSFACLSIICNVAEAATAVGVCLSTIFIFKVQRRVFIFLRRRHRLWRFRLLVRYAGVVQGAVFGEGEPCSICFGEFVEQERYQQIVLLPCRHSIHSDCYMDWLASRLYPSHQLMCPLCRRQATAIGKLPEIPTRGTAALSAPVCPEEGACVHTRKSCA